MELKERAQNNLDALRGNPYPGRGIVVGMDEKGGSMLLAYWIMGRSANSRNRVFEHDPKDGRVWTDAADFDKLTDPTLIIYNAMRELRGLHIVSNGDQTDTIARALMSGADFCQALNTRTYEPDEPNCTPRIAAMLSLREGPPIAALAVLKKSVFGPGCDRHYFRLEEFAKGYGHCVTTYTGDGDPLPSFVGEPWVLPLAGAPGAVARSLWDALNSENRVALAVKTVDLASGVSRVEIINRFQRV